MSNTPLPVWREVVRTAARDAAHLDDRERWGDEHTPFAYRWEHVQAVVRLAVRLAERTGADRDVVEAAAWLHDVAKPRSLDHGRDGAIAARRILDGTDFPALKIQAVADAISKHVGLTTTQVVEPLEAAVLWDADKLSKLGATVVIHGIGFLLAKGNGATGALIEQLHDPEWGHGIVRSLNTAPAREAGRRRLETYSSFCRQAMDEYDGSDL